MSLAVKKTDYFEVEKREVALPIKAIVFDLDGTLVDSKELVLSAFQHALSDFGIQVTLADIDRIRSNSSQDLFSYFVDREKAAIALQRLWEYSLKNAAKAKLFPGMREILHTLYLKNIPLAVWTARDHRSAKAILEANQVAHLFQSVVGSCQLGQNKPHPEGLLKLAKHHLNIPNSNILMIGDHAHDIVGAKSAGSFSAAAGWLYNQATQHLLSEDPDLVFHTIAEFNQWISNLKE